MTLGAYALMLVFDGGVLAGTAYLVDQRAWSPWWFLLAVLIISHSGFRVIRKNEA